MSAPTDADRERAAEAWEEARDLGVIEAIAAALASEREAALAPVRRLIETAPVMWHGDYPVKAVPVSDLLSALALAAAAQPTDGRTGE